MTAFRKPGFNEAWFIAKSEESFYSNFNITVVFDQDVALGELSHALKRCIDANRWLTVNFFRESQNKNPDYRNDYNLLYVTRIAFRTILQLSSIESDEEYLKFLNLTPIPMNRKDLPLWRVTLRNLNTLSVCFCHSVFDGTCGLQIIRDLVAELNENGPKEEISELFNLQLNQNKDWMEIVPAVESSYDLYIPPLPQRLSMLLLHYIPFFRGKTPSPDPPLFTSFPVEKTLESNYKILRFDHEFTSQLVAFSRENGFTLTSLINVIGIRCIEKFIYPTYGPSFCSSHFLAVNGRRYYRLKPGESFQYGMMVCGAPIIFHPLSDDFINDCKEFHLLMQAEIVSRCGFKNYWANTYIDFTYEQNKKIGTMDRYTTMVSNLGKFVNPVGAMTRVTDAYFGLTTAMGYHFIFNMLTTDERGLTLVIPYNPKYLESEMSKFLEEFEKFCLSLITNKMQETTEDMSM